MFKKFNVENHLMFMVILEIIRLDSHIHFFHENAEKNLNRLSIIYIKPAELSRSK